MLYQCLLTVPIPSMPKSAVEKNNGHFVHSTISGLEEIGGSSSTMKYNVRMEPLRSNILAKALKGTRNFIWRMRPTGTKTMARAKAYQRMFSDMSVWFSIT